MEFLGEDYKKDRILCSLLLRLAIFRPVDNPKLSNCFLFKKLGTNKSTVFVNVSAKSLLKFSI